MKFHTSSHFSWYSYFDKEELPDGILTSVNLTYTWQNQTLALNKCDAYIYNCLFQDMYSATNGGAISFSKDKSKLLVEKCSFINCTAEEDTAAIRIQYGNFALSFVCGFSCKAKSYDCFSSSFGDSNRNLNLIHDVSVSNCEATSGFTMVYRYGYIQAKSINLSSNKATWYSALTCYPNANKNGIGSHISYCSFSNNTAKDFDVYLNNQYNTECKQEITCCNIIHFKGDNAIRCNGQINIIHSCIIDNKGPYFYTDNENTNIQIKCSHLDRFSFRGNGSVIQTSKDEPFILALPFISTGNCVNIFDNANNLFHCSIQRKDNHLIYKTFIHSSFLFICCLS